MRIIYFLCIGLLPLMVSSGMVYSILSIYFSEIGVSKTRIGLVFSIGALVGAIVAPIVGKISDRVGRWNFLIFSYIGFILTFFIYSFAKNFANLLVAQIIEGTTWAVFSTATLALISDLSKPDQRGISYGIYNQSWYVGWIAGPVLGGYLSDIIGFRLTFYITIFFLLLGFLFILILKSIVKKKQDVRYSENWTQTNTDLNTD